jgi:3-isopropylmalate/(R)-2-methylmalate dehydratase large subunit
MEGRKDQTLAEKIFSKHCGRDVYAGDVVLADLDLVFAHDTTCAWLLEPFYQLTDRVWNKHKVFIFFDHAFPAPNLQIAQFHARIRRFANEQDIPIICEGVCHQVLIEKLIMPGQLILGADSHTPTGGALGALTIGAGSTDVAIGMATGKCWFIVPETIRIEITGKLKPGVFVKDVGLLIAKTIGPEGADYKVVEFTGDAVKNFSVFERATLTNMSSEMGAKAAIVEFDQQVCEYLKARRDNFVETDLNEQPKSDLNAKYHKILSFDISTLEPLVAQPHEIDNVIEVKKLESEKIKVDQVFLGSCTNARIDDLEVAFNVFKKVKRINQSTRLIITPASREVYLEAERRGYLKFFTELGATVTNPGCGACLGRHLGILYDEEVCVSTSNRNFMGRMGSPRARIYLASPATAAASAVTGFLTDPREFL